MAPHGLGMCAFAGVGGVLEGCGFAVSLLILVYVVIKRFRVIDDGNVLPAFGDLVFNRDCRLHRSVAADEVKNVNPFF